MKEIMKDVPKQGYTKEELENLKKEEQPPKYKPLDAEDQEEIKQTLNVISKEPVKEDTYQGQETIVK